MAGWDDLPAELRDSILGYLETFCSQAEGASSLPLSSYATISRSWQWTVESSIWKQLVIYDGEFDLLESLLCPHRRAFVREVEYRTQYDFVHSGSGGSFLSSCLGGLDRLGPLMSCWESEALHVAWPLRPWSLTICCFEEQEASRREPRTRCLETRMRRQARLAKDPFRSPIRCSCVPEATGAERVNSGPSSYGPRRIRYTFCDSTTPWRRDPPLYMIPYLKAATGVVSKLRTGLSSCLDDLIVTVHQRSGFVDNHNGRAGYLPIEFRNRNVKDLSAALRLCSQNLRTMVLAGRFLMAPNLFWPEPEESNRHPQVSPYWPHLVNLTIFGYLSWNEGAIGYRRCYSPMPRHFYEESDPTIYERSLAGRFLGWELDMDASADGYETTADSRAKQDLEAFYAAAARAVAHMPKLQCLAVLNFPGIGLVWQSAQRIRSTPLDRSMSTEGDRAEPRIDIYGKLTWPEETVIGALRAMRSGEQQPLVNLHPGWLGLERLERLPGLDHMSELERADRHIWGQKG